jgi:transposase
MPRTRPPCRLEFREQTVASHLAGRSCEELSRKYEPSEQTVRPWIVQPDRDDGIRFDGLISEEKPC